MPDNETPLPGELLVALGELVDALTVHGADYALIGDIAAGLRGRLRFTDDIDFLLSVPQLRLPGLLEDLVARGFRCDVLDAIRAWSQHHMIVVWYGGVRVDWLKPMLPLYRHTLDAAMTESWHGRRIRVASAEGLILLKLMASRTQDLADIDSLLAANRGRLDLAWVEREWLTVFPTEDARYVRFRQAVAENYDRPAVEN